MKNKLMRSLSVCAAMVFLILSFAACGSQKSTQSSDKVVNIFTWANYVPDSVVKQFEKQTGIKVNYSNFSTNEEMLAKLQATKGSQYDVVICSDYIIEVMSKQKEILMQPIDKKNIPNYKNVDPQFLAQDYDKQNKYSIPYTLGTQMIVYNPEKVKIDIKGYKDLWNPQLKDSIVLVDDPRIVIGMTLKKLGYSMNETDSKKLNQASEELKKLKPNVKVFDADTPHNSLINGDVSVGYMYGSQASAAVKANPKFKIVYPEEGMNSEEDNFIIPVKAPHKENAEKFINFMLNGKISNEATTSNEYVNTNKAAKQYMSKEYLNNKAVYIPDAELKRAERFKDVGSATKTYDRIWSEFKQQ
ncbi:extracellular solute-binding protein [Clostridium tyrobutyricum]|jgi:spermidine/putrescine transport system substrate-binding protein|uniref:ABC transporter, periplasmic spermidine putrescine-binding protein PotD (TC 3.A.1.11.1) n=1 Tax=Clostridium tyrobutyricum DIVETGP TaxID=1408889 RepID=W6N3I0_CLOTY|nr:spermidine/putrescine ABC transporter substrate-binding protein [Clostridium tyrobutyricum]AND84844.1 spermidine/putrescine ABC transporter substrate-binding protein [Clostridium tyrobutyricum]ANP69425.1 ABC transporter substrate-binding protein [Clostridium tyrobutyricum]MBV4425569.1 spermidine/putrescine ABC transporter substrate-binding protein [Clostridium tyrobutyricum]MBV4434238.1 spermidine/putrescine ABC transporter substrate-binding protein [Clostridium tyrobutyricum]MBV4449376.1 s